MAQLTQKVLDYFTYACDSKGQKMGNTGFKAEDLLTAVRIRSSKLKPKYQGGLDKVIFLAKNDKKTLQYVIKSQIILDDGSYTVIMSAYSPSGSTLVGQNGVTWGKDGVKEIIESEEKQLEVINNLLKYNEFQIQAKYKDDFIEDGPWTIIQNPWNPDVIPPQALETKPSPPFKPEETFIPCTSNGFISENAYTKSYKFIIKEPPTYPEESNVYAVVWVMSLEEFSKVNQKDAEVLAGIKIVNNTEIQRPVKDNYYLVGHIYSFPEVNPKTKQPLYDPFYEVREREGKKFINLDTTRGFRLETQELSESSTVDDFINLEVNTYLTSLYKDIVYGTKQTTQWTEAYEKFKNNQITDAQLTKVYENIHNLPEFKFNLIQSEVPVQKQEATPDPETTQPAIVEPFKSGKYIFNVGTVSNSGILTNSELGTFSVVNPFLDENPYQYTELDENIVDDEYSEVSATDLDEASQEVPKYLIDDRADQPSTSESSGTGTGTNDGGGGSNETAPTVSIDGLSPWTRKISRLTKGNTWQDHAANYISLKEGFTSKASWDVNHYRMGYGTEVIVKNGVKYEVKQGDTCTKEEAVVTLAKYGIPEYSKQIGKDIGANWDKLTGYQKAALTSLGYNVGAYYITSRGYGKRIKKAIDKGDYKEAAKEILNGPRSAGGKVLKALVRRREEEAQLFLLPDSKSIY